jgi:hypothetical protein
MQSFYIFVNFLRGMSRHNLRITKQFTSAAWSRAVSDEPFRAKYVAGTVNYLPFVPGPWETGFISPFCMSAMNSYWVEYDAERVRMAAHPLLPSRLSATYAFADHKTCVEVSQGHGWNLTEVRRFRLEHDALTRVHKCNMEIVSLARQAYLVSSGSEETTNAIWGSYWSGHGNLQMELPDENLQRKVYDSGQIWEYLIEGRLVLEEGQASVP